MVAAHLNKQPPKTLTRNMLSGRAAPAAAAAAEAVKHITDDVNSSPSLEASSVMSEEEKSDEQHFVDFISSARQHSSRSSCEGQPSMPRQTSFAAGVLGNQDNGGVWKRGQLEPDKAGQWKRQQYLCDPTTDRRIFDSRQQQKDPLRKETNKQLLARRTTVGREEELSKCPHQFKEGDMVWRCSTCALQRDAVICGACFRASEHQGHQVSYFYAAADDCGACDCGDPTAWRAEGCCKKHWPGFASLKTACNLLSLSPYESKDKKVATAAMCRPCVGQDGDEIAIMTMQSTEAAEAAHEVAQLMADEADETEMLLVEQDQSTDWYNEAVRNTGVEEECQQAELVHPVCLSDRPEIILTEEREECKARSSDGETRDVATLNEQQFEPQQQRADDEWAPTLVSRTSEIRVDPEEHVEWSQDAHTMVDEQGSADRKEVPLLQVDDGVPSGVVMSCLRSNIDEHSCDGDDQDQQMLPTQNGNELSAQSHGALGLLEAEPDDASFVTATPPAAGSLNHQSSRLSRDDTPAQPSQAVLEPSFQQEAQSLESTGWVADDGTASEHAAHDHDPHEDTLHTSVDRLHQQVLMGLKKDLATSIARRAQELENASKSVPLEQSAANEAVVTARAEDDGGRDFVDLAAGVEPVSSPFFGTNSEDRGNRKGTSAAGATGSSNEQVQQPASAQGSDERSNKLQPKGLQTNNMVLTRPLKDYDRPSTGFFVDRQQPSEPATVDPTEEVFHYQSMTYHPESEARSLEELRWALMEADYQEWWDKDSDTTDSEESDYLAWLQLGRTEAADEFDETVHCPVQLLFGGQGRVERVLLYHLPVGFSEVDVTETAHPSKEQPVTIKWDGDDIESVWTVEEEICRSVEWLERFDASLMGAHRDGDLNDSMVLGMQIT